MESFDIEKLKQHLRDRIISVQASSNTARMKSNVSYFNGYLEGLRFALGEIIDEEVEQAREKARE